MISIHANRVSEGDVGERRVDDRQNAQEAGE